MRIAPPWPAPSPQREAGGALVPSGPPFPSRQDRRRAGSLQLPSRTKTSPSAGSIAPQLRTRLPPRRQGSLCQESPALTSGEGSQRRRRRPQAGSLPQPAPAWRGQAQTCGYVADASSPAPLSVHFTFRHLEDTQGGTEPPPPNPKQGNQKPHPDSTTRNHAERALEPTPSPGVLGPWPCHLRGTFWNSPTTCRRSGLPRWA